MDIYTKTNFRKNLYNILKKVQHTNQPVEILSGEQQEDGASDSMVLISRKEYNELQEARLERFNRSMNNINMIAKSNATHLHTDQEIEDWLNED